MYAFFASATFLAVSSISIRKAITDSNNFSHSNGCLTVVLFLHSRVISTWNMNDDELLVWKRARTHRHIPNLIHSMQRDIKLMFFCFIHAQMPNETVRSR